MPATPPSAAGPLSLTPAQWWCVLKGVRATAERANLALISAGVAFFGLMAVIPGIAAVVAFVGIFGEPAWIGEQIQALGGVAPDAVVSIIHQQVVYLLGTRSDTLALGALFNLVLALWSAVQGTRWVLMALTAVNRRAEKRRAFGRYIAAGMFTLYGLGLSVFAVMLMGVAPLLLAFIHVESGTEVLLLALRWPVLGGAAVAVALILYRWGPRRRPPPWRWLWPGAVVTPLLWLLASSALTFALREFPALRRGLRLAGERRGAAAVALHDGARFPARRRAQRRAGVFRAGETGAPVSPDETIEPRIAPDGGQKASAARAPELSTPCRFRAACR